RFRENIHSIFKEANCIKDICHFILNNTYHNDHEVKYLIDKIDQLLLEVKNIFKLTLEEELKDIIQTVTSKRDAEIYLKRYGWDGEGQKTLEEVGDLYGLTRERARQISKKIDKIFETDQSSIFAPILNSVTSVMAEITPCTVSDLQKSLKEKNIIDSTFQISGLIYAVSILNQEHYMVEKIENSFEVTVVPKELEGITK